MDCCTGIDLGSTTTKAVVMDMDGRLLGKGITNSRSNYDIACAVAKSEALINARFALFTHELDELGLEDEVKNRFIKDLQRNFRLEQHLIQQRCLEEEFTHVLSDPRYDEERDLLTSNVSNVLQGMLEEIPLLFAPGIPARSDFFRDIATGGYMKRAQGRKCSGGDFDQLMSLFDKSIIRVENREIDLSFSNNIMPALERVYSEDEELWAKHKDPLRDRVVKVASIEINELNTVGTGYGRSKLPFRKDQIRSEILCHGLGAHWMFPNTTTVLDIGGQDTKAIQIDNQGIVTSFQMNDRCAAGCGRYLGYIADEMNLGLHELGPLAQTSKRKVKISSTCTVFAGAELRDRMTLGDKREDILAGLHRAMMLRAMSLLARSGGIAEEFTFTGGVAKNVASVAALKHLVKENYGERTINISPDSIYTGAIGAAIFAARSVTALDEVAA